MSLLDRERFGPCRRGLCVELLVRLDKVRISKRKAFQPATINELWTPVNIMRRSFKLSGTTGL